MDKATHERPPSFVGLEAALDEKRLQLVSIETKNDAIDSSEYFLMAFITVDIHSPTFFFNTGRWSLSEKGDGTFLIHCGIILPDLRAHTTKCGRIKK
jgi:hypothetical protein